MLHRNRIYTHNNGRDRCDGMTVIRNTIYKRQQKEAMQKNAIANRTARFAPLVDFARKVLPLLGTAEGLTALADRPDEEQLAYGKQLFAAVAPALDAFQKERAARWKRARESLRQAVVAKKTIRLNRLRSRLRVMQSNKQFSTIVAENMREPYRTNFSSCAYPRSRAIPVYTSISSENYKEPTMVTTTCPVSATTEQPTFSFDPAKYQAERKLIYKTGRHRVYTEKISTDDDKPNEMVWEDYVYDMETNKFRKATEAEKKIEYYGMISADVVNYANNPSGMEPAAVSAHEQFSVQFASTVKCMPISKKSKFDPPLLNIDSKQEISETQIKSVFEKLFGETFPEIKARILQKEKKEKDETAKEEATPAAKYAWAATTLKYTAVSIAAFAVFKGASIVFSSYILSA